MTTTPDRTPAAKPILLTRDEVRAVLNELTAEIRRAMRPGRAALQTIYRAGAYFWVREAFSTRVDGERVKVRYPADGPHGEPHYVPIH